MIISEYCQPSPGEPYGYFSDRCHLSILSIDLVMRKSHFKTYDFSLSDEYRSIVLPGSYLLHLCPGLGPCMSCDPSRIILDFNTTDSSADLRNGIIFSTSNGNDEWMRLSNNEVSSIKTLPSSINEKSTVVLNRFGNLVALWNSKHCHVRSLIYDSIIDLSLSTEIVWVGWSPHSLSSSHLTVLCENGELRIFEVNEKDGWSIEICHTTVISCEDATLRCLHGTFDGPSLWVLLENGDLVNVYPWMPVPSVISKDEVDASLMSGTLLNSIDYLITDVRSNIVRVSKPCLIQPEPIEVAGGNFHWIESVCYRGLTFIFMNWGNSRIDIFLVAEKPAENVKNPTIVLLESIDFPCQEELSFKQMEIEAGVPRAVVSQGLNNHYIFECCWADDLIYAMTHNSLLETIKGAFVHLPISGCTSVLPFQCVVSGRFGLLCAGDNGSFIISSPSRKTSIAEDFEPWSSMSKFPLNQTLNSNSTVETVNELNLPKLSPFPEIGQWKISNITDDTMTLFMESIIKPLRESTFADVLTLDAELNRKLEFMSKAIHKQLDFYANLSSKYDTLNVMMHDIKGKLSNARAKETKILEKLESFKSLICAGKTCYIPKSESLSAKLIDLEILLQSFRKDVREFSKSFLLSDLSHDLQNSFKRVQILRK